MSKEWMIGAAAAALLAAPALGADEAGEGRPGYGPLTGHEYTVAAKKFRKAVGSGI